MKFLMRNKNLLQNEVEAIEKSLHINNAAFFKRNYGSKNFLAFKKYQELLPIILNVWLHF